MRLLVRQYNGDIPSRTARPTFALSPPLARIIEGLPSVWSLFLTGRCTPQWRNSELRAGRVIGAPVSTILGSPENRGDLHRLNSAASLPLFCHVDAPLPNRELILSNKFFDKFRWMDRSCIIFLSFFISSVRYARCTFN